MSDRRGVEAHGAPGGGVIVAPDPPSPPAAPAPGSSDGRAGARRSRIVGAVALAACLAVMGVVAAFGNGLRNTDYDFVSPGVWLPLDGRVTHIALATGAPDQRINLGPTFPAGFTISADAQTTVLRSDGGTCHLDRLDEAKLNLAKRDPRLVLGDGPCSDYAVRVGGHRVYVVERSTGEVRQLDERTLGEAAPSTEVPLPIADLQVDGDGLLVVVGGPDAAQVRAVRDGEVLRSGAVPERTQVVRVGERVALVDAEAVRPLGATGDAERTIELPSSAVLDPPVADQPGGRIPLRVEGGGVAVVRIDGEVERVQATTEGQLLALGPTLYELTPTGATRFRTDGRDDGPLALAAAPPEGAPSFEAVASHGRLWIHRSDESTGWACESDGTCRRFEKDDPDVPEVTATEPDEPDPPKTIAPGSVVSVTRATAPPTTGAPVVSEAPPATEAPPAVVVPPGPVEALTATAVDRGALLAWRPPLSGSLPDAYRVQVRGRPEEDDVAVVPDADGLLRHQVAGLANGETYTVTVWATSAGVVGTPRSVEVTPTNRTPTGVSATIEARAICGGAQGCPEGDEAGTALVTWTDAVGGGVEQYQVGCDAGTGVAGGPAVPPRTQRAVVRGIPAGTTARCWVESAGGGGRVYAAELPVVGLPTVTVAVQGRTAVLTATNLGQIQEVRVDGAEVGTGADGTVDLSGLSPGPHTLTARAANLRGLGPELTQTVDLSPDPVSIASVEVDPSCCSVTVAWSGSPPTGSGYSVTTTGLGSLGCAASCATTAEQAAGYTIALGGHRAVWEAIVGSLGGASPFGVVADVSVTVAVAGYPGSASTAGPVRVAPSTPGTVATDGAPLWSDAGLSAGAGSLSAGTELRTLCAVRDPSEAVTAFAVRTAGDPASEGYLAAADVSLPADADIPTC